MVKDPRRKVIELYDGNKGKELLENIDHCPCSLVFSPSNYEPLNKYLFDREAIKTIS
jgi:hypothetical protein